MLTQQQFEGITPEMGAHGSVTSAAYDVTQPLDWKPEYDESNWDPAYDADFLSDEEPEETMRHLRLRNRLDMARMFLGKQGGYSVRTFKKMVKRAKEDGEWHSIMGLEEEEPAPVEHGRNSGDRSATGEEGGEVAEAEVGTEEPTAEDVAEMKEKAARLVLEELEADSDIEEPGYQAGLAAAADDDPLQLLLDKVEFAEYGDLK